MTPRISVVIPTFNRAQMLMRAVASVRAQTMDDFEVIVVDDGSTDNTEELLATLEDGRIRYLRADHLGAARARNRGLEMARARVVTFLDSDDEAKPTWLETITRPFEATDVGITCVGSLLIDSDGRTEAVVLPQNGGPLFSNETVHYMGGTFAARREILDGVGGYRDQSARQQKELGRRITRYSLDNGFRIVAIPEPLIRWHQHAGPRISTDATAVYEGTLATIEHDGESIRTTSRREYARLQRSAAFGAMRMGLPRDAGRHLVKAIRADPRDWRAYARLGQAGATILRDALKRG